MVLFVVMTRAHFEIKLNTPKEKKEVTYKYQNSK